MRERRSAVAGDTQFTFQHVLLRDVAYGQIPRRARAEKHRRAAEWIEGLGRPDDNAELLAYHYKEALALGPGRRRRGRPRTGQASTRVAAGRRRPGDVAVGLRGIRRVLRRGARAATARTTRRDRRCCCGAPVLSSRSAATGSGFWRRRSQGSNRPATSRAWPRPWRSRRASPGSWATGLRPTATWPLALEALEDRPPSRSKAEALSHQSGFDMLGRALRGVDSIRRGGATARRRSSGWKSSARASTSSSAPRVAAWETRAGSTRSGPGSRSRRAASDVDMVIAGYSNLSSELHFIGETRGGEARMAARARAIRALRG